jgi:hypothetical protein
MTEKKKAKAGSDKTKTKAKDTTRKRKKSTMQNTQRYIPFAEIRNNTVVLKNGGLRAVLLVEPLNFNLKSETEQQGIIAGYEQFINTLYFPLQIVMRSNKVNIDPYLELIRKNAEKHEGNLLMKEQTLAYADFVQKVVDIADIMQKRFYVIIPLDDQPQKKSTIAMFLGWMNLDDSLGKALTRNRRFEGQLSRLKERMDLVETGLRNIGLVPKQLTTVELIQLFYKIYNPHLSQTQKLPKDGDIKTAKGIL